MHIFRDFACRLAAFTAIAFTASAAHAQSANLSPIAFQFSNQGQQSGGSLVGTWHSVQQIQLGAVMHTFWTFGADGSVHENVLTIGSGANGLRLQQWGRYQVTPATNGGFALRMSFTGHAPLQTCIGQQRCTPTPSPQPMAASGHLQGNFLTLDSLTFQRDNLPREMMAQMPARQVLQPPPSPPAYNTGGGTTPSGGYNPPKPHVPGVNSCDNLQQQRVCTINDGTITTDRNGCQHCIAPY